MDEIIVYHEKAAKRLSRVIDELQKENPNMFMVGRLIQMIDEELAAMHDVLYRKPKDTVDIKDIS